MTDLATDLCNLAIDYRGDFPTATGKCVLRVISVSLVQRQESLCLPGRRQSSLRTRSGIHSSGQEDFIVLAAAFEFPADTSTASTEPDSYMPELVVSFLRLEEEGTACVKNALGYDLRFSLLG
jgi:hypothetical protein